ncbi:MAG: 1,4-alpha-glucan branching protein GlgB [Clostridia bacterium]|nr:1,4-alpha-glucan branching protein GlgB [Clostridia bacterium]
MTEEDLALARFHSGAADDAYRFMGAHGEKAETGYRYTFRTLAPRAEAVYLVADFCGWETGLPMHRVTAGGIFELIFDDERELFGSPYKFRVVSDGGIHLKGDPFALASRGGDDGASVLSGLPEYVWQDGDYLSVRRSVYEGRGVDSRPFNVYEVHLGSFLRREDGTYLTYRELAETLLGYVKYMGYTHVELLPIAEYPYDGSWGYQVGAYYAPTARFGTPEDLCALVDRLHAGGIGVILDWVPAHFPKDEWGLYEFDGAPLYEYSLPWRRETSWGTRYFDLSRPEVRSFLISNALFWLREYHVDGLRVDAVSSMLYLDYDRRPGEWEPSPEGDNKDRTAVEFFRQLNDAVKAAFPDALMIAEESTSWPLLTYPTAEGGLGFDMKWNMGFSNDVFAYLSMTASERTAHHTALNFPITYAFSERYVLPISHDEVVHGKRSLLEKICGGEDEKRRTIRTVLLLFMTFPGKKLLFMGTEYGQRREWNFDAALTWEQLEDTAFWDLREYVAALNRFYLETPALYECDTRPEGFRWLLPDESERHLLAFVRRDLRGEEVAVVLRFSAAGGDTVHLPMLREGRYASRFCSGGGGEEIYTVGADGGLTLTLPPYSGAVLVRLEDTITL